MAKGFKTVRLLNGKEPLLRQIICEVRVQDGHLYLDHTGRLLKKLIQASPEWVLGPLDPNPKGTVAFHLVEGLTLSFSINGASLDLNRTATDEIIEENEAQQFAQRAEETLGLVFDELEVKEWARIGVREIYYFPCESKTDAEQWLEKLALCSVSTTLAESFNSKINAVGLTLVMDGEDCSYRIALNGAERPAQVPIGDNTLNIRSSGLAEKQSQALTTRLKQQRQRQIAPAFSVVLDIDAYRLNPVELEVGNFIQECIDNNLGRFRSSIPNANGKKGK
jgi:hypothetical protein